MNYRPYSPEWHRYRYLKEAINKYLDDYVDNQIIIDDILSVVNYRSETAFKEFTKLNDLESKLRE
jgi:hypothetical protein